MEHVFASSSRWRAYAGGMYTYGSSWYLDIECGELHYYHALAEHSNQMLAELPDFLEQMRGAARHLVTRDGRRNLPTRARHQNLGPYWSEAGIHLLGGAPGKSAGGVVHADYEGLAPYPAALFDPRTQAYSCILSLQTPATGGGLELWTAQRHLGNELGIEARFKSRDSVKIPYRTGTLTIIDSFLYHRVRECTFTKKAPWRAAGVMHFLLRERPSPHWEYWF